MHFSTADQRSIDLVFFVNGLPVATVELKTDFTQSLNEAIQQYRQERNPLTHGRPRSSHGSPPPNQIRWSVSDTTRSPLTVTG
ncbi:type I restriction endonuclease [Actinomadura sp. WAC 06369]|uniref:type I restriction endonuclease n=1 Tax=Actinomadura sp. WAC 06369 TaxID=2203193 RepID=UPI0018F68188|nr:type I restriction endonuclease [Actinomadura sp. WAC 06369]